MIGLLVLAALPRPAGAPIFGFFPGLDKLIEASKHIVVADIVKAPRPRELDMGAGGIYSIYVVSVLKGDAKAKSEAQAYLRNLPYGNGNGHHGLLKDRFIEGNRYVLFLQDRDFHMGVQKLPKEVQFKDANYSGDAFWVPYGVPEISEKDPRTTIEMILQKRLEVEEAWLRDLREDVANYLEKK